MFEFQGHGRRHRWGGFWGFAEGEGGRHHGPWGFRRRFFEPGEVRVALLSLLKDGPKHGYELMKELEARSGGMYRASAGTVYPNLQMLEDEGLIRAEVKDDGKRVYTITGAGRAELEKKKDSAERVWSRASAWDDWSDAMTPGALEVMGPGIRVVRAAFRAAAGGDSARVEEVRAILKRTLDEIEKLPHQAGGEVSGGAEAWRQRVEAHHAQTKAAIAKAGRAHADLWSGLAEGFRDDPRRAGDPVVDLVAEFLAPQSTVLDVGGGAGRYALPLALRCREVTVVEPSEAMRNALRESAKVACIENVSVVSEKWEDAEVDPADVVLCAHVFYGVTDIASFITKLDEKATAAVVITIGTQAPLTRMSPLWEAARREKRIDLPALPELLPVLLDLDIYPDIKMIDAPRPLSAPNLEAGLQIARHFLYINDGSEEDKRLTAAARELMEEAPEGGVTARGFTLHQAAVYWRKR